MKYPVVMTETFNKLIIVEADSEREAIDKCWDEFSNGYVFNNNPISIDYLTNDSNVDFEIGTEEDKAKITEHEDNYDYLN